LFSKSVVEPRRSPRVKRPFDVTRSSDGGRTFRRVLPVDLSAGGVGFVAEADAPADFEVSLRLERKTIKARAQKISSTLGTVHGKVVWRIGARFTSVSTGDQEMIERFIHSVPLDVADDMRVALRMLRRWPDEADRLLPRSVVNRLLAELVKLARLSPLDATAAPLVHLHYTGSLRRHEGELHGVKIESRVVSDGKIVDFQTQMFFDEALIKIEAIPLDDGRTTSEQEPADVSVQWRWDWRRKVRESLHLAAPLTG